MAIPLGPDWNKLYEEGKCLDRGIPFTDEQQEMLFKLKGKPNYETLRWELIRKWRADAEVNKLSDPKQLQAKANAEAFKEKLGQIVLEGKENAGEKPNKTEEDADDVESKGEEEKKDYASMSYNELKALAKEKGIEIKNPKKDDLVKALEELGE